jgi:hypothetical protein
MSRVGEQPWVGQSAVEQCHVVPVGQQGTHDVAPDELGPADYKDLHDGMLSPVQSPSALSRMPAPFVDAARDIRFRVVGRSREDKRRNV